MFYLLNLKNQNDEGDDEDGDEDDDGDGEEEDEDEEDGDNYYDAPEGIQWTLYLPIRMSPILFALQNLSHDPLGTKKGSFCAVGVTVRTLQDAVKIDRIFPDEVCA